MLNGVVSGYWSLSLPVMANLYRFGRTLLSDQPGNINNASYLFDKSAFFTAKAMNIAIPGGPKFEPLYRTCICLTKTGTSPMILVKLSSVPSSIPIATASPHISHPVSNIYQSIFNPPAGDHLYHFNPVPAQDTSSNTPRETGEGDDQRA
jgi:hypothetical protein